MRHIISSLWLLGLLAYGCDDNKQTTIDCTWFAGDNCWKHVLATARACVDQTANGTLSADRKQCTYPDGTVATSTAPFPDYNQINDESWDFTITKQGQTCVSVNQPDDDSYEIVTSLGMYSSKLSGMNWVITCPDSHAYSIDVMSALNCGSEIQIGPSNMCGSSLVIYKLLGADEPVTLLDCSSAP